MSALLEERSKLKTVRGEAHTTNRVSQSGTPQSLTSLVESVKRKNAVDSVDAKRQKL
jgi:hypothetical protein